jgi:hypothetical protein
MTKRIGILLVFLVTAIAGGWYISRAPDRISSLIPSHGENGLREEPPLAQETGTTAHSVPVRRLSESPRAQGVVLDAVTQGPVAARVKEGDNILTATEATGRFSFMIVPGARYQFCAPGYVPSDWHPGSESEYATIALLPEASARIVFQYDNGAPCIGVRTTILLPGPPHQRPWTSSSDEGIVDLPLAGALAMSYKAPNGQTGSIQLQPGQFTTVVVSRQLRQVTLWNQDQEPLANVKVEMRLGTHGPGRASVATTDDEGVAWVAPITGPQQIILEDAYLELLACRESGEERAIREVGGGPWALNLQSELGTLDLVCSDATVLLRVLESGTLAPVSSQGVWGIERYRGGAGSWTGLRFGSAIEAQEGKAEVSLAQLRALVEKHRPERRLTLLFEGYEAWSTQDPETLLEGHTVLLEGRGFRALQLHGPSGSPFTGRVRIVDQLHDRPLKAIVKSDSSGLTPRLPWSGGDWLVIGIDGRELGEVPAAMLAASSVVAVTLQDDVGSIRIVDVPIGALPPEACLLKTADQSWDGRITRGTPARETGEWIVSGIAPGEYIVGPSDFAQWFNPLNPYARPTPRPTVTVQSGEETVVTWDPIWRISDGVSGRILTTEPTSRLRLFALPPTAGVRKMSDGLRSSIPLSPSGGYTVPRGRILPSGILVALEVVSSESAWNGLLPITVIAPGESITLDEKPLRIRRDADLISKASVVLLVSYDEVATSLLRQYLVDTEYPVYWGTDSHIEIPFIGSQAHHVRIRNGLQHSQRIPLDSRHLASDGCFVIRDSDIESLDRGPGRGLAEDK